MQYFVSAVFKNQFSLNGVGEAVGQLRSYGIPAGPGCSGPILFTSSFTGLSVLSRRRHAAVQSLPDSGRLPRRHARRRSTRTIRGGRSATTTCICFTIVTSRPLTRRLDASAWSTTEPTSARSPPAFSTRSGCAASRSATTSAARAAFSLGLRDINGYGGFATQIGNNLAVGIPPAIPDRQRALRQLRKPRRRRDAQSAHRKVRLPRRRRRRDVA